MTKEQEEAIERLNRFKTVSVLYSKTLAIPVKNLKELQVNIEAVLNMLKENSAEIQQKNTVLAEKNAEIEKLKADNKKAWELNANMSQRHLSDIFKIKKKDKQIDLMLDEYEYNARINLKDYCDEELRKNTCIEDCKLCIKQYFERKVKNGN